MLCARPFSLRPRAKSNRLLHRNSCRVGHDGAGEPELGDALGEPFDLGVRGVVLEVVDTKIVWKAPSRRLESASTPPPGPLPQARKRRGSRRAPSFEGT